MESEFKKIELHRWQPWPIPFLGAYGRESKTQPSPDIGPEQ